MKIGNSICPCIKYERKGCGSYHDQCKAYKTYKEERFKLKSQLRKHNIYTINK